MRTRAGIVCLAWLAASCQEPVPRAEVIVTFDAEPGMRESLEDLQVRVLGGEGRGDSERAERFDQSFPAPKWPLSVTVVPIDNDETRVFEIVGEGLEDGEPIGRVRAISGFVGSQTRYLTLVFRDSCRMQLCTGETTCLTDGCVDAHIDVDDLKKKREPIVELDAGGRDAGGDAGGQDGGGGPEDGGGPLPGPVECGGTTCRIGSSVRIGDAEVPASACCTEDDECGTALSVGEATTCLAESDDEGTVDPACPTFASSGGDLPGCCRDDGACGVDLSGSGFGCVARTHPVFGALDAVSCGACVPNCSGKECGPDGCEGTCAPGCSGQETCNAGSCVCVPACGGKECGPDGCGGSCAPGCPTGSSCNASGACVFSTSCIAGETDCNDGVADVSCCKFLPVSGGTFPRGRCDTAHQATCNTSDSSAIGDEWERPEHSATVAAFNLSVFETTVGRFRRFVSAYGEGYRPVAGAGAIAGVIDSGWRSEWDDDLPADEAALRAALACDAQATWTDTMASNELLPINCVDWFEAFAFCIWDGGRLPSEAEWEYAAAGGSLNRLYPWGPETPDATRAVYNTTGPAEVGSKPAGVGFYGHLDLGGSVHEWAFDSWALFGATACTNCVSKVDNGERMIHGGWWMSTGDKLRPVRRLGTAPTTRGRDIGFRCAK